MQMSPGGQRLLLGVHASRLPSLTQLLIKINNQQTKKEKAKLGAHFYLSIFSLKGFLEGFSCADQPSSHGC